jgi:hypothetical protein
MRIDGSSNLGLNNQVDDEGGHIVQGYDRYSIRDESGIEDGGGGRSESARGSRLDCNP